MTIVGRTYLERGQPVEILAHPTRRRHPRHPTVPRTPQTMSHPDSATARYGRVLEGSCPYGTPLQRRDDYGWCPDCRCGWRIRPDTIDVVLAPETPAVLQKPST